MIVELRPDEYQAAAPFRECCRQGNTGRAWDWAPTSSPRSTSGGRSGSSDARSPSRRFPRPGSRQPSASTDLIISTPRSLVRTPHSKDRLITRLKEIERALGRVARPAPADLVTIDIDLLVYDLDFAEDDLWSQVYRARPVAELLPDLRCPATGESVLHAANRLAGSSPITPRPEIFASSRRTGTSRTNTIPPSRTRTP